MKLKNKADKKALELISILIIIYTFFACSKTIFRMYMKNIKNIAFLKINLVVTQSIAIILDAI